MPRALHVGPFMHGSMKAFVPVSAVLLWASPAQALDEEAKAHPPGSSSSTVIASSAEPVASTSKPPWRIRVGADHGFAVDHTDGTFGLQLGMLVQTRYDLAWKERPFDRNEVSLRMARPTVRAHLLEPWIRLFVQPELAGPSPRLLDLEVEVQPIDEVGVKAGQLIVPFSRAFMTPVPKLDFFGFTVANDTFRANRDTGAMVFGYLWSGHFEYFAGAFNGNGINQTGNDNTSMLWVGRIGATLIGRPSKRVGHVVYDETEALAGPLPFTLRLGGGAYGDDLTKTVTPSSAPSSAAPTSPLPPSTGGSSQRPMTMEEHLVVIGADAALRAGHFSAQWEGYARRSESTGVEPTWSYGTDLQLGYFVVPKLLELSARQSFVLLRADSLGKRGRMLTYEGQMGYFPMGNHLKVATRYLYANATEALDGFAAGETHGITAQAQVWF